VSAKLSKKARSEVLDVIWNSLPEEQRARIVATAAMPEDLIDTSDIPEVLDWSGAARGKFYRPIKRQLTLRVDADVVDWFQKQAPKGGYQTAMNRVLREAMLRGRRKRTKGAA
jgi:uncharacterized protein (DUF4415 family)